MKDQRSILNRIGIFYQVTRIFICQNDYFLIILEVSYNLHFSKQRLGLLWFQLVNQNTARIFYPPFWFIRLLILIILNQSLKVVIAIDT